jgi:pimeloyl-ACP methyl ester carboxylesterase
MIATVLCLCSISFLVYGTSAMNFTVYAQSYLQTIKQRNLVIVLGNGLKTNAQLTFPAVGKGPFPGVLLVPGGGPSDMNYTLGVIRIDTKTGSKIYPPTQFFQIAQYLSERGFAVLRYDKRGVGANHTILDTNVWGNVTFNDLKSDTEKALDALIQQPEFNKSSGITIIGHSEGTTITPRIAIDNPDKVKNIVLWGAIALNIVKDNFYILGVTLPVLYAQNVLDKNHSGLISAEGASKDTVFLFFVNTTGSVTSSILNPKYNTNKDDYISINNELKPALVRQFEKYIKQLNTTTNQSSAPIFHKKCDPSSSCPIWARSHLLLSKTLSIIGNVSPNVGVLILEGENDAGVQQALLLQQRLAEVNHPDHTLITFPNLGHYLYPSDQWETAKPGPIPQYVLADLYSWIESHSGFTHTVSVLPSSYSSSSSSSSTNSTTK